MRNIKTVIAYEGTDFHGWQVQPGRRTIQGEIEGALALIEGAAVKVHGSGRTDAGVHARGQAASFRISNPIPVENLRLALNHRLPPAIRILDASEAPEDFHARYSATAKTYEYRIYRGEICSPFLRRTVFHLPYPLDEEAMFAAAPRFEGERDFRSLATNDGERKDSTVRTIFSSRLAREGEELVYRVRGSGFLYNMVRNIVGVLIEIGRGSWGPEDVERILAARDRRAAGPTAPAPGLFLLDVEYGGG
ncbi:MAG: tRNA pseudouridine(38-40) synthase TruA [Bryobacterales bacterium]|nr:tRNA pseudouridine(38-40) synthase TruA [Acidobacteriota bacterium]MCB9385425.1 tRNA pseudouridine(38-40) synthase TruA [Bryobacterales bacterium]